MLAVKTAILGCGERVMTLWKKESQWIVAIDHGDGKPASIMAEVGSEDRARTIFQWTLDGAQS